MKDFIELSDFTGDQLAGLSVDVKDALALAALETHGSVLTVDDGAPDSKRPGRKKKGFFAAFRFNLY